MSGRERIWGRFSAICPPLVALLGCRTPTQITVEVTTEIACDGPATHANTTLTVGTLGTNLEDKPPVVVTSTCTKVDDKTWRIGSLVLVPSGDKGAEIGIRVVTGINKNAAACASDSKDCIVARRALRFVPHTELYLPIGLDVDCIDVPCGTTTTCVAGKCVGATIDDSSRCTDETACDETALPKPSGGDAGVDGDAGPKPGSWSTIAAASVGRDYHKAVWTGTEMIVFGGQIGVGSGYSNTGERYDPKTNGWRPIATSPLSGRRFFAMHWTGTEVLVWGGEGGLVDGARYDPKADSWTMMKSVALTGRDDFVSVYAPTRGEMIVWGGAIGTTTYGDGARYSVASDSWTIIPDPSGSGVRGRSESAAVWDGARMLVYGGFCPAFCDDTAAYDPAAPAWTSLGPTTVPARGDSYGLLTGTALAPIPTFFGGGQFSAFSGHADGAWWDGTKWVAILEAPAAILPDPTRVFPTVWAANDRIHVWGGYTSGKLHADGAVYDRAGGTWSAMPASPLSPRLNASVVWTGSQAIVFGGDSNADTAVETELSDGAIFTP